MESEWMRFFTLAGIPDGIATRYAGSFSKNRVTREMVGDLDKETLVQLGVTAVGDQMAILKRVKAVAAMEAVGTAPPKNNTGTMTTRISRAPISAPSLDDRFTSLDDRCASVQRRGKPPPDRHEIYHVKMPEGKTMKSKKIMQNLHELRRNGMLVRGSSGVRQAGREVLSVAEQRELDAEVSSTTGGRMGGMHVDRGMRGVQSGRIIKQRVVGGGSSASSGIFGAALAVAGRGSVMGRKRPLRVEREEGGRGGGGLPSVTVQLGNRVRMGGGTTIPEKKGNRYQVIVGGGKRGLAGRVQGGARRGVVQVQYEDEVEEEEMEDEMYGDEGEEVEEEYEDVYEDEMEEESSTVIVGPSRGGQRVQTRYVPMQKNTKRGGGQMRAPPPVVHRNASIFDRVSF
ncbi:hypothetical protein PFISCL1PPCAC_2106, partial [Pristionchus fissidentatus]